MAYAKQRNEYQNEMKEKKSLTYRLASALRFFRHAPRPRTAAIILSGGSGTRLGGEIPKQFLPVGGIPILVRSVIAFESSPYIDEIVIVSRRQDIEKTKALCAEYGLRKVIAVVKGADTRQGSALSGFAAIGKKTEFVAIHDAARCMIEPEAIADVVAEAYACRAASAGYRVKDTIKETDACGNVLRTVDRERLYAAATPQVFDARLYRAAAYSALRAGVSVTDDNALCERIGQTVRMIDCGDENFKITTRTDLEHAELIFAARELALKKRRKKV